MPRPGLIPGGDGLMVSAVSVALLDCSGVVVSLNPAWLDMARHNGEDPGSKGLGEPYLGTWAATSDPSVSGQVTDMIRAALRGDLPAAKSIRSRFRSDQARCFDQSIASRFADSGTVLGATVTMAQSDFGLKTSPFAAADLRDEVVGSLFGAGLALHGLVDRLTDPADQRILETAVDHLNDVVCNVRLMVHTIDIDRS